jgi:cytochrome c peroxidase
MALPPIDCRAPVLRAIDPLDRAGARKDIADIMTIKLFFNSVLVAAISFSLSSAGFAGEERYKTPEALGEALFNDASLSKNGTEACSTCHMPGMGFRDGRDSTVGLAVALGDDGKSLGDRNVPSAAYAHLSPPFHKDAEGKYVGGQFWDGRASTLEDQAGGPPLNPIEMGMPDKASVAKRIEDNPDYVASFKGVFGKDIFTQPDETYAAMTKAIAAYERTEEFSPFDSKYDRYLRGEVKFTDQEELGRVLFFSHQFTNCNQCHEVQGPAGFERSLFTNHKYFNIGVPENTAVRMVNGTVKGTIDTGLAQNPMVDDPAAERGKFKVPSLRNVAVTGPYMHNGVFKDLRTVVKFYNKYNSKAPSAQINPETGKPWGPPEVADNIATKELTAGSALNDKRIDAIVAFLKTLTDKRYEPLLDQ